MPWQEHDQPSLFSFCHMELSICSKQTHPRLLRLASESCIFGRMCVCIVHWERSWKKHTNQRGVSAILTCKNGGYFQTSRSLDHFVKMTSQKYSGLFHQDEQFLVILFSPLAEWGGRGNSLPFRIFDWCNWVCCWIQPPGDFSVIPQSSCSI